MNLLHDFKSEIKLFLIVAVVSAVLAVGGILLMKAMPSGPVAQTPPPPAPAPSPQPLVTSGSPRDQAKFDFAGWQTYRNAEFGFEVRYPGDWFNTTDKERNTIYDEQGNPIELKHYEFSNKKEGLYGEYDANVVVFQIDINEDIKFFERIQKLKVNEKSGKLPVVVYTKLEDFTIDGYPAVRYVGDYSAIPAGVLPRSEEVLLMKSNNVFHFMLIGKFGGTVEGYKNVFDQILSTFRFVP